MKYFSILIFFALLGCRYGINPEADIITPEFATSEGQFLASIQLGDSVKFGYGSKQTANWNWVDSEETVFLLMVHSQTLDSLSEREMALAMEKLYQPRTGIVNIRQYDLVEFTIMRNTDEIFTSAKPVKAN